MESWIWLSMVEGRDLGEIEFIYVCMLSSIGSLVE